MSDNTTSTGSPRLNEHDKAVINSVMEEFDRRNGGGGRRSSDMGFTEVAKAADAGIVIGRRWVEIAIMFIGFGIGIGLQKAQNDAFREAFQDFRTEIRASVANASSTANAAVGANRDLAFRVEQLEKWQTKQNRDDEVRDLRVGQSETWIKTQDKLQQVTGRR